MSPVLDGKAVNVRSAAACAAIVFLLALAVPARAALPQALPLNEQQVEERLKSFDPEAVAAARRYYLSPAMKDGMLSIIRSLSPAMLAQEKKQCGCQLSDKDSAKLVESLDKAMAENVDFLIGLNMVVALEVLSKNDLIALANFYSSPVGQDAMGKMPQLSQRLPSIMQSFLPLFMSSLRSEMKANGLRAP
jgi:hypothetical protein